jgi:drug/metabolite transporter (DMT)-like permease
VSKRGLVLFVAMGVIWGIPYLLIKVAVRDVSPATLVFLRTGIAAVVLVPLAAARGALRPAAARWRLIGIYTLVELAVPWVLLSTAEERLPSSLSGLLVAAVPLAGLPIGLTLGRGDREAWTRRGVAGLVLGLLGVVALLGFDVSSGEVGSAALVAVVVVGYALGPAIVARSLSDVPALGVIALSLLLCTVAYAPFGLTDLPAHAGGRIVASVAALGLVCTAVAFVVFFALIAEVGPVRATVVTYVNPAVAVLLGVVFLHEALTAATVAGFVLILAGSWLATRGRAPAAQPVVPVAGT